MDQITPLLDQAFLENVESAPAALAIQNTEIRLLCQSVLGERKRECMYKMYRRIGVLGHTRSRLTNTEDSAVKTHGTGLSKSQHT